MSTLMSRLMSRLMSAVMSMQPRDRRAAARTIWTLCAVAGTVSLLMSPLLPSDKQLDTVSGLVMIAMIAAVVGLCWGSRRMHTANLVAWAVCPFLAVAAIVTVDLLTQDASLVAQIYFVFPILYGASQLRPAGAVALTVTSALGEIVVVATLLPTREAIVDGGNVIAVLVTTAALLTRAGVRQADLVARLEALAASDPLTGLVTRRVFDEAAGAALSQDRGQHGTSLILLDVDSFKDINDQYGHPGGDRVLVQLAALLRDLTRPDDVLCRLGGDEVAVLLPGCSAEVARHRAEEIVRLVQDSTFLSDQGEAIAVSVSVGLAHAPSHGTDLRSLYAAADAALYRAKQTGRNRAAAASPEVDEGVPVAGQ